MSAAIETTGPDIESAVQAALAQLGVTRDQVQVDVLEEPQRRLLGLGNKLARVRVTPLPPKPAPAPPPLPATPTLPKMAEAPASVAPLIERDRGQDTESDSGRAEDSENTDAPFELSDEVREQVEAASHTRRPLTRMDGPQSEGPEHGRDRGRGRGTGPRRSDPDRERSRNADNIADADAENAADDFDQASVTLDDEANAGIEVLEGLLTRMQISATVRARPMGASGRDEDQWLIEVRGEELGDLIGYRGETLSALQYITRLIASGKLQRRVNFVVDVEGYKSRREEMLRRLARRMAAQAIERGRTVSMEPMPPNERRIIHMALEDNPAVTTESVGEGEKRKVTIIPKKSNR